MATEIRAYTANVPAGTTPQAYYSLPIAFPVRVVDGIEILVPDGANGVLGFALYIAGICVIPFASDAWIVTSGEKIAWPLEEYPTTGQWELRAYNTGSQPHAVTVRFLLSRLNLTVRSTVPMIEDDDLTPITTDDTGTSEDDS